jgi:hypothetical protein
MILYNDRNNQNIQNKGIKDQFGKKSHLHTFGVGGSVLNRDTKRTMCRIGSTMLTLIQ